MVKGERIVCASPDYLRRRGTPLHPNELPQHSCLAYRPNLADSLWRFRGPDGALIELKAGGNLQTDNGFVLRSCLLQGAGIALMPDWSVSRELKNGQIVRIFEAYSVTPNEFENGVFAVYQSSRHDSPKLQAFLDFVAKLFKELAVPGSTAERSQISASLDAS